MFLNGYFWFKRWLGLIAYVCIHIPRTAFLWMTWRRWRAEVRLEGVRSSLGRWVRAGAVPWWKARPRTPGRWWSVGRRAPQVGVEQQSLTRSERLRIWILWRQQFFKWASESIICSPAWFLTTTLSMPASSCLSISTKSPTVWVTGRRTNTQRSFLQGFTKFSQKLRLNNDQPCVKQKPVKTKFWINSKTTFQIPLNFWTINSFMKLEKIIKIGKGGLGEVKCPKNKKKCH